MNELAKGGWQYYGGFYVIFDLIFTHSPHASRHMARQPDIWYNQELLFFFLSTYLKIQEISSWCLTYKGATGGKMRV